MAGFQVGSTVFPLVALPSNPSLLKVADPALAKILDFFAYMITANIETALVAAAAISHAPIDVAVNQVAPINPDVIAKAEQWRFPAVFGWRQSSKDSDRTLNWRQGVATIGLAYVLPALSPTQRITLDPILAAVGKLCNHAFRQGTDPGYNSGERIFTAAFISRARLMTESFGTFRFDDAKPDYFPSWIGELELTEQDEPYTVGIDDLDGADITVTQQADDGQTLFGTGTNPPAVTITGPIPLPYQIRVEIQSTGPRGTATFRVSIDDGAHYVATGVVTAATYAIPGTSDTLNFPVGTYTNNNVFVSEPVVILQASTDVG